MITSPLLVHRGGYVGGHWVEAVPGKDFAVRNPATGELLGRVPDLGEAGTREAVAAAAESIRETPTPEQRQSWLAAVVEGLDRSRNELARIITMEQGKPLGESQVEVDYAAGFFRFYARHLDALKSKSLSQEIRGCRWEVHHRPAGVAGLISPWNFPLAMMAKKLSAAMAAGCGVVAKPAALTPLTAIALWHLLEKVGVPPGWLNLVVGAAAPIGKVLCEHPLVRVLSFTGSTEVGKVLLRDTAPHIKRLSLELGGNAPFLVFEDADVELAVESLIANKFRCAGQTCVCANRILVHSEVLPKFLDRLVPRVEALKMGNGMEDGVEVGPLINREAFDKVARHVEDALAKGAKHVAGREPAKPRQEWGCFYPPTVLTGMTPGMQLFQEETFGPVVAVGTFGSEEEALRLANATPYGLSAYVFTRDMKRLEHMARGLSFGHVGLNTGTGPTPEAPFGGMKQSGFGREGGFEGLAEFCEIQTTARAL